VYSTDINHDLAALIEAQDILDELGILRAVLTDQDNTLRQLQKMLVGRGRTGWVCQAATQPQLERVDRMQKMATSAKESVGDNIQLATATKQFPARKVFWIC
jgi:hypothetical protein